MLDTVWIDQLQLSVRSLSIRIHNMDPGETVSLNFRGWNRIHFEQISGDVSPVHDGEFPVEHQEEAGNLGTFSGTTEAYTVVNAGAGVRLGGGGRYMIVLKVANLANTSIQNHVFGDILRRQVTGVLRIRL